MVERVQVAEARCGRGLAILAFSAAVLAACAPSTPISVDIGEVRDQTGHAAFGSALANELLKHTDDYDGVRALVMSYAAGREALQHDDQCGANCQRDMLWWRRGVDAAITAHKRRDGRDEAD